MFHQSFLTLCQVVHLKLHIDLLAANSLSEWTLVSRLTNNYVCSMHESAVANFAKY